MRRHLRTCSLALLVTSCAGAVEMSSPILLGASEADLLTKARSLVFSLSTTRTCADLVDLSPSQIDSALAEAGEDAPVQVLSAPSSEHVFGKVDPTVPIAYFVLASAKTVADAPLALSDLAGSVFAIGCRDFQAPSGSKHDLPITLFPLGLR